MRRGWIGLLGCLLPQLAIAQGAPDVTPELAAAVGRVRTAPGALPKLRIASEPGAELPLRETRVRAELSGFIARVEVVQQYVNDRSAPVEVVYVFPLPENAAVDDLKLRVADRTITAHVRERREARATYEQARRAGRTAALLEQERPNVFTQSVANIPPGETVEVAIRYVQPLTYDGGEYEFVFPMVVGPRFIPGTPGERSGTGWSPDTDEVPDASRVTPPVLGAGTRSGHDIRLELTLDAGMPIRDLEVPTHEINAWETDGGVLHVRLAEHETLPNRDFVLRYRLDGDRPQVALLAHRSERGGFFSLYVQPPELDVEKLVGQRELVFVVDVSGSMSGVPLAQAKAALRDAVRRLRPVDTFDVLSFAGTTARAFGAPRPANAENVAAALRFVEAATAGGGTRLADAVDAALRPAPAAGRHRYVVFLTDGYVGNEAEILALTRAFVQAHGGAGLRARVFGVGVGSSVNRHLIDGLGKSGEGLGLYLGLKDDPARAVERLFHVVDRPVLTDVRIDWGGLPVTDVTPDPPGDLFASRPLVLHGRYDGPAEGKVVVRGRMGGRKLELPLQVVLPGARDEHGALASLWARARVEALEQALWDGEDPETVAAITALGLAHGLVTAYTSFVAVDSAGPRVTGPAARVVQPVEAPDGVDPSMVFGGDLLGGLGVVGHGQGGGGGPRSGGYMGAAGYGRGVARYSLRTEKREAVPRRSAAMIVASPAPRAEPEVDSSDLSAQANGTARQVQACYASALRGRPGLAGKITVQVTVAPDGTVRRVEVLERTIEHRRLERCLVRAAKTWRFPRTGEPADRKARYTHVFRAE